MVLEFGLTVVLFVMAWLAIYAVYKRETAAWRVINLNFGDQIQQSGGIWSVVISILKGLYVKLDKRERPITAKNNFYMLALSNFALSVLGALLSFFITSIWTIDYLSSLSFNFESIKILIFSTIISLFSIFIANTSRRVSLYDSYDHGDIGMNAGEATFDESLLAERQQRLTKLLDENPEMQAQLMMDTGSFEYDENGNIRFSEKGSPPKNDTALKIKKLLDK